jgi:glutathione synthase/RimK-type ligase-like ATP-grasp enzyme
MVSGREIINTCRDMHSLFKFLIANSISTPNTILLKQVDFSSMTYPLIAKPRRESCSKDLFKVKSKKELFLLITSIIRYYNI